MDLVKFICWALTFIMRICFLSGKSLVMILQYIINMLLMYVQYEYLNYISFQIKNLQILCTSHGCFEVIILIYLK